MARAQGLDFTTQAAEAAMNTSHVPIHEFHLALVHLTLCWLSLPSHVCSWRVGALFQGFATMFSQVAGDVSVL